ncbi:MAG: NADH-quinone oxidoreductase subunit I [Gracilimonas sp.]|nr:NADH-quinone oxidoreductase subunit I [Gracilimonas sp.]
MDNVVKEGWMTFKSIFTGMGVTLRHLFGPTVTELYPEEKVVLPAGARAKLYVNIDDCIGCNLCARACPVNCIDIETVQATSDVDLGKTSTGNPKRFWLAKFDIDMAKCMYCDLCTQPCPTNCIYMVPEYEYSDYDRSNLLLNFSDLTQEKVEEVKKAAEEEAAAKQREREEKKRQQEEAKKKKEAENQTDDKSEEEASDSTKEKE